MSCVLCESELLTSSKSLAVWASIKRIPVLAQYSRHDDPTFQRSVANRQAPSRERHIISLQPFESRPSRTRGVIAEHEPFSLHVFDSLVQNAFNGRHPHTVVDSQTFHVM